MRIGVAQKSVSWFCAIFLGLSALVSLFFFAMPRGDVDPVIALPRLPDGVPNAVFSGRGSIVPDSFLDDFSGNIGIALRLVPRSIKAAFLVDLSSESEGDFYGAFLFPESVVRSLKNGKIPLSWGGFMEKSTASQGGSDTFRYLQISGGFSSRPIYCVFQDGLVLLSSSPSGLQDMVKSTRLDLEPSSSIKGIEPYWDGHMRVDLRGKKRDLPIPPVLGETVIHCAWRRNGDESGAFSWRIEGIDGLSASCPPADWGSLPDLPSPLGSVWGLSYMGGLGAIVPVPWKGSTIFATGGKGAILSVPFPGMVLAEIDPSGESISERLKKGPLSEYRFKPLSSDLYSSVWIASSPATVMLADSERCSLSGIIDVGSLREFDPFELDGFLPPGWGRSFSWGYVNGPSLAQTLEGLVKAGRLLFPEQKGISSLPQMDSLVSLTRRMRKIGTFSFVMPNLTEGTLLWR
ncbi:MAG: hypothetical protein PHU72_05845 [Dethiosulfovibrio sp.]|nr:hypothetical protein [Dethiosulfovibrio sp.]